MVSIVRFPYLPHPPHVGEGCVGRLLDLLTASEVDDEECLTKGALGYSRGASYISLILQSTLLLIIHRLLVKGVDFRAGVHSAV